MEGPEGGLTRADDGEAPAPSRSREEEAEGRRPAGASHDCRARAGCRWGEHISIQIPAVGRAGSPEGAPRRGGRGSAGAREEGCDESQTSSQVGEKCKSLGHIPQGLSDGDRLGRGNE